MHFHAFSCPLNREGLRHFTVISFFTMLFTPTFFFLSVISAGSLKYFMTLSNALGKIEPVKIGLKPVQWDNVEYEFDIFLNIGRNHIATTSKYTTFLDSYEIIVTPDLGLQLAAWL